MASVGEHNVGVAIQGENERATERRTTETHETWTGAGKI
jgi:hypothetical protein